MLKIGITGGIGSGKSLICKIFASFGVPVFNADAVAKRLMQSDRLLKEQLIHRFGPKTFLDNQLNTAYLGTLVFGTPSLLIELNKLVHPVVIAASKAWMEQQKAPYLLKEAALLFESNAHLALDYVIGVQANENIRIARVMSRDHLTPKSVLLKIKNQLNEEEKLKRCQFIINNNGSLLTPAVYKLHLHLLELSSSAQPLL